MSTPSAAYSSRTKAQARCSTRLSESCSAPSSAAPRRAPTEPPRAWEASRSWAPSSPPACARSSPRAASGNASARASAPRAAPEEHASLRSASCAEEGSKASPMVATASASSFPASASRPATALRSASVCTPRRSGTASATPPCWMPTSTMLLVQRGMDRSHTTCTASRHTMATSTGTCPFKYLSIDTTHQLHPLPDSRIPVTPVPQSARRRARRTGRVQDSHPAWKTGPCTTSGVSAKQKGPPRGDPSQHNLSATAC